MMCHTRVVFFAEMDWSFIEHPKNLTVTRGQNVTLTCRPPLSRPAALVSWFKNNHPFTPNDHLTLQHNGDLFFHRHVYSACALNLKKKQTNTSHFGCLSWQFLFLTTSACSVQESDSGSYFCRAANLHLQRFLASRRATLTVQGVAVQSTCGATSCASLMFLLFFNPSLLLTPAPPSVNVWPQMLTVPIGARVLLECEVSGQPLPSISWMKRGHSKHTGGRIAVG